MRRRCEALARKYRDSDEGRPDSDELTDDAETARKVSNEPPDEPETEPAADKWRTDLYGDSGPSY
ncbi:MAG: hypothetical protein WA714_02530 [Candidatus Acidiferrales bacterium]